MVRVEDQGFEQLAKDVIKYLDDVYPDKNKTFKVSSRRARKKFPLNSAGDQCTTGGLILDAYPEMKVDVHNPDIMLNVEIRSMMDIYSIIIPGPGGMPVGTSGKAMLLLSGGIDSPVAGYMIAKRGVTIDATYFHAPPYTSERAKQKVVDLAKIVAQYSGPIKLNIVNFTDIQLSADKCPHDELTIIMRRYMMKIAEHSAKENGCLGLVTGESIGQVASQTMQSLAATNDVVSICSWWFCKMILSLFQRKLKLMRHPFSHLRIAVRFFVAKHPVTKPNLNIIKRSEKNLSEKN